MKPFEGHCGILCIIAFY